MPDDKPALRRIWLTSKSRMHAEKRYKLYSRISHLLLCYYSLGLVGTSIFSTFLQTNTPYLTQTNTFLAVAIFAASLVLYGMRFDEMAHIHRECYLRLDRLLTSGGKETDIITQYNEIIAGYPNHSDRDFDNLLFDRIFWNEQKLYNSEGEIKYTYKKVIQKMARIIFFWSIVITFIVLPVAFIFYPISQVS